MVVIDQVASRSAQWMVDNTLEAIRIYWELFSGKENYSNRIRVHIDNKREKLGEMARVYFTETNRLCPYFGFCKSALERASNLLFELEPEEIQK